MKKGNNKEKEYQNVKFQTGNYEGIAIYTTITAKEQREAAKSGITLDDLIEMESYNRDWQCDC